jgi:hypothetical protein
VQDSPEKRLGEELMSIGGLLGGDFKDLGLRFNLVGLVPTALTVMFIIALLWSGAPKDKPDILAVLNNARSMGLKDMAVVLIIVVPLSLILQPLQLSLVRILEGYWGDNWLGKRFATLGVRLQSRGRRTLENEATRLIERQPLPDEIAKGARAARRLKQLFPSKERLLPTRLGNILRSAEENAGDEYGLDAVLVWPWLYPLLPANIKAAVTDQRNQLDFCVRTCACCLFASVVSTAALHSWGKWLLVPVACLVMAWVSYEAALLAAVEYGTGIRVAVTLHRFDLLTALHLPLPKDLEDERKANQVLCVHLQQLGANIQFIYVHGSETRTQ